MNFHLPESYLSNLDKHRQLQLPARLTPELSLEMGIDLGDGSLFHSPVISRRGSYYVYSISQRFPDEWFGIELILKPLIRRLYNLTPKSKHSSLSRNGINVYTYSRGLFFFKNKVLGLPSGPRSRVIMMPSMLSHSIDHQARFWTGYQYSDGSFYCSGLTKPVIKLTSSSPHLLRSLCQFARSLGVEFSFGREHHIGYSLRILSEQSIMKWVVSVPLLNPVHAARFLLWHSGTGCPPRLHISQYVELALGAKDTSEFKLHHINEQARRRYLEESVILISLACIGSKQIAFDKWWHRANLANAEHANMTLDNLVKEGYVRKSLNVEGSWLELTHRGFARLEELDAFWEKLESVSPVMASLELEEGLSCRAKTGAVWCPGTPR